jgi:hypothetical protein
MQVRLAKQDCSRILQPSDYLSVSGWNPVFEQLTRSSGANTNGVDVILQGDRDSVERSSPLPLPLLLLRRMCRFHRLTPRDRDEGIQRGIVGFNVLQASLSKVNWRSSFAAKQLRSFLQRQAGQVLRFAKGGFQTQTDSRSRGCEKKASAAMKDRVHFLGCVPL